MTENLTQWQNPEVIREALAQRKIAIVGLSSNELRASNFVGYYLRNNGYEIVPVNPREEEIFGLPCYASVADIPFEVDVVDVFRASDAVPDIARQTVAAGIRYLWLQFGVISPEGIAIAADGGVDVIVDKCIKIEHARYQGRMHWLGFNTGKISARRD